MSLVLHIAKGVKECQILNIKVSDWRDFTIGTNSIVPGNPLILIVCNVAMLHLGLLLLLPTDLNAVLVPEA